MLELGSVHLQRSGVTIIKNLNFSTTNHRVVVSGKNGVGKTTLLLSIAGLFPCASGKIAVAGVYSTRRRRFLTGIFSSAITPPEYLSVNKIINLSGYNNSKKIKSFEKYFLSGVNLHADFRSLSEGSQRKTGISFALRSEKGILILDEPYNALDEASVLLLKEYLNGYKGVLIYTDHTKLNISSRESYLRL